MSPRSPGQTARARAKVDVVEQMQHEGVQGAQFDADATAILSWSREGTVQMWSVGRTAGRNALEVACSGLKLDTGFYPTIDDYGQFVSAFGIEVDKPVCEGLPPWPDELNFND